MNSLQWMLKGYTTSQLIALFLSIIMVFVISTMATMQISAAYNKNVAIYSLNRKWMKFNEGIRQSIEESMSTWDPVSNDAALGPTYYAVHNYLPDVTDLESAFVSTLNEREKEFWNTHECHIENNGLTFKISCIDFTAH